MILFSWPTCSSPGGVAPSKPEVLWRQHDSASTLAMQRMWSSLKKREPEL